MQESLETLLIPRILFFLGHKFILLSSLSSDSQQLPRITVTSVRYTVVLTPSSLRVIVFVYPSDQ
jgi:trafficking protein particle complex subunit 11